MQIRVCGVPSLVPGSPQTLCYWLCTLPVPAPELGGQPGAQEHFGEAESSSLTN